MSIHLKKTLAQIEGGLTDDRPPDTKQLRRLYDLSLRLQSQILAVIRNWESFSPIHEQEHLAVAHSTGYHSNDVLTLILWEPLPAMKKLTEAIEEH